MPISPESQALIDRLNRELNAAEEEAINGLDLVRLPLSRFPDNIILVQFFAYLNNVLFFVENYRQQIGSAVEQLSVANVTVEENQEVLEELASMLGVVLETKIRVERIITRLRELP